MEIIALIILLVSILSGFVALFFTTIGTLIILIGSVTYAFLTHFDIITVKQLVILFILYLLGETLENFLVIFGTKKFGASNWAVAGAFFGGIIGALFGLALFGVGLVLGAFLGIFLGAFLVELIIRRDLLKSLKAGTGGILGRVGSIVAKVIIAFVMIGILASRIIASYR
ncbi:MAG: DUF456 domain-containing protein [Candidatus Omnitrophota bacterium]